jgi:alpha-1,3/alpha-1,6-mannosyltransferase
MERQTNCFFTRHYRKSSIYPIFCYLHLQKIQLLKTALILLYTPVGEHFGIVPCEAMLAQCPVLGTNTGGLLETVTTDEKRGYYIVNNLNLISKKGFLRESDPVEWAKVLQRLVKDPSQTKPMGLDGRKRVINEFSEERLANHLDDIMQSFLEKNKNN